MGSGCGLSQLLRFILWRVLLPRLILFCARLTRHKSVQLSQLRSIVSNPSPVSTALPIFPGEVFADTAAFDEGIRLLLPYYDEMLTAVVRGVRA